MSLNDDFMEKIENEYGEFSKKVEGLNIGEITKSVWDIAQFQKVYNFIKLFYPFEEKYQKQLMKYDKPIETICRVHNRMPSSVNDNYMVAISAITDHTLHISDCSKKVNEMLVAMNDGMEAEIALGNDVKQQEKAFKVFINSAYEIKDEDAEVLLQFKNPLEIIMHVSRYNKYSLDNIKDAAEYVNGHDIYTMPFDLNHDRVTNEAKCRHEAIEQIRNIVPNSSFKTTIGWLDYFRNFGIQQGEKQVETDNLYEDFVSTLENIRGEFGPESLQQVYDFGSNPDIKYWDVCEDSLVVIAEYLNDDGDIGKVNEMAQSGYFLQPYEDLQKQLEQGEAFGMNLN